jgi:hypothetical protein
MAGGSGVTKFFIFGGGGGRSGRVIAMAVPNRNYEIPKLKKLLIFIEFPCNFLNNMKIVEPKNELFRLKCQFLPAIFPARLTSNISAPLDSASWGSRTTSPPLSTPLA